MFAVHVCCRYSFAGILNRKPLRSPGSKTVIHHWLLHIFALLKDQFELPM